LWIFRCSMVNKAAGPEGRFLVGVAAVIEHKGSGNVLILKKTDDSEFAPGIWEISTGLLKQFETPEAGLIREVKEETGLSVEIVKPLRSFHAYRGQKTAEAEMVGFTYWCKTNSKRIKISREHSDYRWIEPKKAKEFLKHKGMLEDMAAFLGEKLKQR
jgi:8-oxo-dGTP diphosphatase